MNLIFEVDANQQAGREQGYQRGRLNLVPGVLYKAADLPRRFSTAAFDTRRWAVSKIRGVQFSNAIIGQSGALPDGPCSRFMANHSQRELELTALS